MAKKRPPAIQLDHAIEEFFDRPEMRELSDSAIESKRRAFRFLIKHARRGRYTYTRNLTDVPFTDAIRDIQQGADEAENLARHRQNKSSRTGRRGKSLDADRSTYNQFADFLIWKKWVAPDFRPMYAITHSNKDKGQEDPRESRELRIIPFEDWPALLDAATHPRDRMMIAAGLWWGRRPGELTVIQWGDIDRAGRRVKLFNLKKGRRVNDGRPLPMGAVIQAEYDRYLAWYRLHVGEPAAGDRFLPAKQTGTQVSGVNFHHAETVANWPLDPTRPLTVNAIGTVVHKALTAAFGWTGRELYGEGGHTLRRAAAVWAEEHGGLAVAQALLDHGDASMTMKYTKNAAGKRRLSEFLEGPSEPDPEPDPEPEPEPEPEPVAPTDDTPTAKVIDLFSRRQVA